GAPASTLAPELLPYEAPPPRSGTAAYPAASSATAAFGAASPPAVPSPGVQLVPARTTSAFAMGNARQQNLTLMLTDIVGFTARTSRQTREENARMLEEHDQLLLPVFKAHGGRVLQKRGDSFLVGFGSPTESVLCGMELQDRLWRRNKLIGKKDPLEVRVAIHLGEILLTRDGPMGEPVQILAAVEEAASANEVVFTEAVNLAMIRAEVRAEPRGDVAVPGRQDRLTLYRCAPAAEGPPFGGRDLSGKAARPKKALRNLGGLLHHTPGRTALALGVVALIAGAVAVPVVLNSTPHQVRAALKAGDFEAALALLEAAPKDQRSALLPLRVAALHAAGRHRDELGVARSLEKDALANLDGSALLGLSEDFARDEDAALKKLLGQVDAEQLAELISTREAPDRSAWGALRYLDGAKALPADRLAQGFIAALTATDCPIRAHAARRLGELKSAQATEALERLAKEPKQKDPVLRVIEQNCGQDEAALALRTLGRSAQR
ncbi:MAG: adenylate/guanylate cyclase domain-containing protein, partial [Myxococcota bacterium]|nr:adenylate/guanylate cyclase domain-containing protein [Myxococcota bacterium]